MVSLWGALGYDGSKTELIVSQLKKKGNELLNIGDEKVIERLNKYVDTALKTEENVLVYLDYSAKRTDTEKYAKYMLVKTGIRDLDGNDLYVSTHRGKINDWSGAYVGKLDDLIDNVEKYEEDLHNKHQERLEMYRNYREAVNNGIMEEGSFSTGDDNNSSMQNRTVQEYSDIWSKLIEVNEVKSIINIMLDSASWNNDSGKHIMIDYIKSIVKIISANIESDVWMKQYTKYTERKDKNNENQNVKTIMFNSGLIADDYEDIVLIADMVQSKSGTEIQRVRLAGSKTNLELLGFSKEQIEDIPKRIFKRNDEVMEFKGTISDIDIGDRDRMRHVIEERNFRLGTNAEGMSNRELTRRVTDSLKIGLRMNEIYSGFIVPSYNIKSNKMQYMFPLYLSDNIKLHEPDAAMIVGKIRKQQYYTIETVIYIHDAYMDAMTVNPYIGSVWLRRNM